MRIAVLGLAASSLASPGATQDLPSFGVDVEAVYLDVFATRKGAPLPGLGPADFEVLDHGVPQKTNLVDAERVPLGAILALDTSDSVKGELLSALRTASRDLPLRARARDCKA